MSRRVVVVGAGVAGLATAYRLLRAEPNLEVTVLEASETIGGRLRTVDVGGLQLEAGPDAFVARKPWAVDLCDQLGLELEAPRVSGARVWTDRGLVDLPPTALGVPAAADELARWSGLSRGGRARALGDLVRKARARDDEETLGSLIRRRLGDEATDSLVAPLLAGLFAGDVDRLGVHATFPELAEWERRFGSLIRGARAALKAAAAAGPMFRRPVGGVAELPRALAARIGPHRILHRRAVEVVTTDAEGFVVRVAGAPDVGADAVVLAGPSFAAATALRARWPEIAQQLDAIPYVSTGVVHLIYPEGTEDALPNASGFVVPRERAPMTAATFVSRKWPHPDFGSRAIVRCFVGAAGSEDVLDASDEQIVSGVCAHLAAALALPARASASAVIRWPSGMPQYEVGHLERVGAIERSLPAGIFLAGNAYRGVGVADTVRGANRVADGVLSYLVGEAERSERVR